MVARHTWVCIGIAIVAAGGCKKDKKDGAAGSGSDVASGSALGSGSGSAPVASDAAGAVVTPPPATADAAPAPADAAGAAAAPSEPAPYAALPEPPEACEGAKCVELAAGAGEATPDRAAYFKQGCATRDGESCARLAVTFDEGLGVPKDLKTAAWLYDRACGMDVLSSCQALGSLLLYGKGKPPDGIDADTERGLAILDRACKAQHWPACTMQGDYYMSNGQRDTALPIYRVACDHKDKRACDALAKVK
jgi:TPR repeat protein